MRRPARHAALTAAAACVAVAALSLGLAPLPVRAASVSDNGQAFLEYEVKAAFVLQLLGFVEWPDATAPGDTITVGVVGDGPMSAALATLHGERSGRRVVAVRQAAGAAPPPRCQVLYLNGPEAFRTGAAWRAAAGRGVLTIADQPGFAGAGGMVNLVVVDGRVGLEINPAAAARAGVKISSKVMRLARIVPGGE